MVFLSFWKVFLVFLGDLVCVLLLVNYVFVLEFSI